MRSVRYTGQILMQLEFFRYIFEKSSNIKFHENPSSGGHAVQSGHTKTERQLIVAFRNFAKAPTNKISSH
jgi:hypothetical protein